MFIKSMKTACIIATLTLPSIVYAADCRSILAKLPKHTPESSDQAQMVDNFEKNCKNRPDVTDATSLTQCVAVGMRAMAVAGNFVAAEKIAKIECEAGNDTISKNWMGMIVNNQKATQQDRDVAQEAINNNTQ